MFDTAKVQQMTVELEKFAREHEDIYVIPEWFTPEAFALFRRMQIKIRAVLFNTPTPFARKEIFGVPVLTAAEASANFNERTAFIMLKQKSVPFMQTTVSFNLRGGVFIFPAFVMATDEVSAVYDRLTLMRTLQQYQEDGLLAPPKYLAVRFARGLTTFLDPRYQNFKYQFWDSREYFKPTYDFDDTAIVIQGPLVYENNYTAETFKLYRSIYPNAPIVVSTWKNEATDAFRKECENNSVVLLENEMPENRGLCNANMQLVSSFQGVKYVQENTSAKFVLKTRADHRINRFEFLLYFKNLLETFPPKGSKLTQRIIFLNSTLSKNMPFFFYDFLAFGHILDISRLYNIKSFQNSDAMEYLERHPKRMSKFHWENDKCSFDYNFVTEPNHELHKYNKMIRRFETTEMFIARNFYEKHIGSIDKNKMLETSWKFTGDYLILIDWDAILLDWFKYEYRRYLLHYEYTRGQLAFARWLDMYRNFKIDWV